MLKIKFAAIAVFLLSIGIVLSSSEQFSTSARTDVLQEIASYKNWSRITKEPIKVEIDISAVGG